MSNLLRRLFPFVLLAVGCSPVFGEQHFQTATTRVTLVELFTSEGCSSCPPAEEWLSQLTGADGLWKTFVPVAFHVDYWDRLGWRDASATRKATERQYAYAKLWNRGSVFTPCFVRDGHAWNADQNQLREPSRTAAGVLTLVLGADRIAKIGYTPAGPIEGGVDVTVALLGCGIVSPVRSGENAGRELHHDFSVLVFSQATMQASSDGAFSAEVTLPKGPEVHTSRRAIAVWVSRHGTIAPLQVLGGWLNATESL